MKTRGMRFIALGSVLLAAFASRADPVPTKRVQPLLVVDAERLPAEQQWRLLRAALERGDASGWPTRILQRGERMSRLLAGTHPAWGDLVSSRNQGVAIADPVDEETVLRVPPILSPKRGPKAAPGRVQLLEVKTGRLTTVDLNRCSPPQFLACEASPSESSGWAFAGTPEELSGLYETISPRWRRYVYAGSADSVKVEVQPWAKTTPGDLPPLGPPQLREQLERLQLQPSGELVLLDFFADDPGGCSHGKKVKAVADLALKAFGAQSLGKAIAVRELAFYPFNSGALATLDAYIATNFSGEAANAARRDREALKKAYEGNANPRVVPVMFLQALYDEALRRGAAVVSSAYYVSADAFKVIPARYDGVSRTLLVSAVLNDPGDIEDVRYEPQRSFFLMQPKLGLVLVGAYRQGPTTFGTGSRGGDGVTCVARGYGYSADCVSPGDSGTSFATPLVSTMLLVAKAYWAHHHLEVNALEARRRLLISSEAIPSLAHRYASMGPPRLERLLKTSGVFVVTATGSVEPVADPPQRINYTLDGVDQRSTLFRKDLVPAVQYVDGQVYIFIVTENRWRLASEVTLTTKNSSGVEVLWKPPGTAPPKGLFAL